MARAILSLAFSALLGFVPAAAAGPASPEFDLVLYGATGCVGGFAAKHLAEQPNLRWAVAGRNASEVKTLAEALCAAPTTSSCPKQIVGALDNRSDPSVWVRRTRAVATAAGPFSKHGGEVLLSACARLGVHYTDTSDEFYWQREMIDKYDKVAKQSGARIVLSSGFCALAGDLGSQLALQAMGHSHAAAALVDSWLERYNGGISAGVINTMHAMKNASFPKAWNDDPYVLVPELDPLKKVDTSVTGLGRIAWDRHEGTVTQNIFGPYDARLLRRSFSTLGLAVALRVGATPSMYTSWTAFLASHPGSWSSLATCPTQAVFDDGSWRVRVRAAAGSASGEVLLSGSGDPGYRFTSGGLAEVGLCLAGWTEKCLRGNGSGGAGETIPPADEAEEELLAEAQCAPSAYVPPDSQSWDWPLSRHEKKSRLQMVERDMDFMDRKALLTELVQLRGICRRHSLGEAPSLEGELLN